MLSHFAYIDPGTGSLFIQAVFGAILGGIFVFRRMLMKLSVNVRKLLRHKEPALEAKVIDE